MIALLALAAAAGWGSSDYAAGAASRRSSALSVVVGTHVTAALVLLVASLGPFGLGSGGELGSVSPTELGWGLLAGVSGGVGALFLYRGLARGAAAVVAPITAAGAALLPAIFGLVTGDPTSPMTLGGIGAALVAIVLVSLVPSEPGPDPLRCGNDDDDALVERARTALAVVERRQSHRSNRVPMRTALVGVGAAMVAAAIAAATWRSFDPLPRVPAEAIGLATFGLVLIASTLAADAGTPRRRAEDRRRRAGVGDALISGAGFALFYILSAEVGDGAGLWPMAAARSASAVVFGLCALVVGGGILPMRGTRWPVLLAGVLDGVAAGCFLVASGSGSLSVVSVLSSLYPIATVALARVVDGERIHARHLAGAGVAAVAVALLAVG